MQEPRIPVSYSSPSKIAGSRLIYHCDNFSLHLPDTREDIRVQRVRDTESVKRLRLDLQQVLAAVVHSTTDSTIFPPRMLHVGQLLQLGADLFGGPSLLREREIPCDIGARRHELILQILNGLGHLLVNLASDTGGAQKDGVEKETDGEIDIAKTADKAVAAQRIEGLADVAENEEEEYNVSDSISQNAIC